MVAVVHMSNITLHFFRQLDQKQPDASEMPPERPIRGVAWIVRNLIASYSAASGILLSCR